MKKHTFLLYCDFIFPYLSKSSNLITFTKTTLKDNNRRMLKVRNYKVKNNEAENQQTLSK